jgi:hypothetical protein
MPHFNPLKFAILSIAANGSNAGNTDRCRRRHLNLLIKTIYKIAERRDGRDHTCTRDLRLGKGECVIHLNQRRLKQTL